MKQSYQKELLYNKSIVLEKRKKPSVKKMCEKVDL